MKGKIVNLCIGFLNIVFGILLLIFTMYIPEDIADLTVQELRVKNVIKIVVYIFLMVTVAIDGFQYNSHKDNGSLKTSYLFGIFTISFILIKEPFIAILPILSGLLIIKNTLRDNMIDLDSTTLISVMGLFILAMGITIMCTFFYKNLGQSIKNKENKGTQSYVSDYFKYITELETNDIYINVQKDGKYGYINQNGDVVIDFKYDYASPFINIKMYNKQFQVALVCQDGLSCVIMKNERKVMSYMSESADENYGAKMKELEDIYKNTLGQGGKMKTEIPSHEDKMKKAKRYQENTEEELSYTYRYDYTDEYDILVTESSLGLNTKFELAKKGNLAVRMPLDCENIDYDENYVYLYNNATIPYFNISSKEQGWFTTYGKKNIMTGKAQILEFIDDKILIRNYNDNTIYFINSDGDIVSDVYKDIYICEDKYIVKNKNDKCMVIGKDFQKLFEEEYDIIDCHLVDYGLYVCANTDKAIDFNDYSYAKMNWKIVNNQGETLFDNIGQIYDSFYAISNDKSIAYVTRYEEFLENLKDIKYSFVGDKFYEVYTK